MKKMPRTKDPDNKEGLVIAVFDFDGTLTYKSTTLPFLKFVSPLRFYLFFLLIYPVLIAYFCKLISVDTLNYYLCWLFFKNKTVSEIQSLGKVFAQQKLSKFLRKEAIQKLRLHQNRGDKCLLATSAYAVYINHWAEIERFDGVVSTEFETNGQVFTGKLLGKSCYGEQKIKKLAPFFSVKAVIYAYGDSRGDRELLEYATHPFYRCF
ncbi:TPA: HAD-IB family hydrolase [Legionella pneumophila subsp. pneumophila]|nr:HAD-IB family hydrolase [Legionella pneumophila subsp. pneumophila]HAT9650996.1 HAD-IB family hydrolase [Legionella pneumophila subsp. pneumophila]HAT9920084.1 HAD-IB family hydrolase [Legionella pneumophila subsp. pneumophila]